MYVNIVVMTPNDGYADDVRGSMERYGAAATAQTGFKHVDTIQGANGDVFGIAVWESEDDANAARPHLQAAVADDDFETWVADMHMHPFSVRD
jgi:heme-degrading monooxygenase HmoA